MAAFEDLRKIKDPIRIGYVIKPNGDEVPVLPKFVKPTEAITAPFKDYFRRAGYRVSADSPAWDLKEGSIRKEWGPILVGGSIDELEVVCKESLTVKKYTAKVRLTLVAADTRSGRILYKVTTESSDALDHVLFSEEKLGEQLNIALSEAVEKILGDKGLANIIREVAAQHP